MLKDSQTAKDVLVARRILSKLKVSLDVIDMKIAQDDREGLLEELFNYENLSEQMTNNARLLPIATGFPKAKDIINDIIIKSNNINICYTKEGWFYVNMPSLLPKKEKGNSSYIRATLNAGIKQYFSKNEKIKFQEDSVIIFKHNYSKEREYRAFRDHDNIELNSIVDIIALYVLIDDCPMRLKHFYCSTLDETDNTEIYIIPFTDFKKWIEEKMG